MNITMRTLLRSFAVSTMALAIVISISAPPAPAQSVAQADTMTGPTASVRAVIDQTIVVFKDKQIGSTERERKLREIAESRFDFGEMARSAVGYHWRSFTPSQKSEFVPLFTSFIEDAYLSRIEEYSVEKVNEQIKSVAIQFNKQTVDGDYAQVFSTVSLKDRDNPIQLNYLMRRDGNEWKIYDLTIDAISVIANYRNQFNRVLNSDGYDKLVSIMREKTRALGASMAK